MRLMTKAEIQAEREEKKRAKQTRYDTTKLAIVYARQSTKEQKVHRKEAAMIQHDDLIDYAINTYQWPVTNIYPIDENLLDKHGNKLDKPRSASGRLDKNLRAGLRIAEELIEAGKVGAVFVRDVSRLFRDPDMVNPPQFAKLCKKYHVVIITFDAEYDLNATARDDLKDFLEEAESAREYLHFLQRTLGRARERKGMRGEYVGHAIPTGYMLDERRKNYVPNPLWCDTVKWLTHRFRELDANLNDLYNEIRGRAIFCELPDDIRMRVGRIHLRAVQAGYTIAKRESLVDVLINPSNIGHKTFKGHIVKYNAHAAIVDKGDYDYALAHLGEVDLDGNVIEREKRAKRFTHEGREREGLLAGVRSNGKPVITSSQGSVYVFQFRDFIAYTIVDNRNLFNTYKGSISIHTVDSAISSRLEAKLQSLLCETDDTYVGDMAQSWESLRTDSPTDAIDKLIAGEQEIHERARSILAHVAAMGQKVEGSLGKLDETIAEVQRTIARKQRDYAVASDVMSDTDIKEHYASLARLRNRLADLEAKKAQETQIEQDIERVKQGLTRARKEWMKMDLEEKRAFLRLITQGITMDELSDRWLKLTITWSPVLEGYSEYVLFYRPSAGANWAEEEDTILRDMYPQASRSAMLAALPRRSMDAIRSRAGMLRIARQHKKRENLPIPRFLSMNDVAIMGEYGISHEEIADGERVWWGTDNEGTMNDDGWLGCRGVRSDI